MVNDRKPSVSGVHFSKVSGASDNWENACCSNIEIVRITARILHTKASSTRIPILWNPQLFLSGFKMSPSTRICSQIVCSVPSEFPLSQIPKFLFPSSPNPFKVCGKLPTYPSPELTLTLTSHLKQSDGLGEG